MGQKVHPHGFRIGYLYGWESHWYAGKHYTDLLHEDLNVRRTIERMLPDAGVAKVEIDRNANQVTVTIHTARPGIVIGRGGQRVDELRATLERLAGRRMRVNIVEIRMPEVEAALVARSVADQLERRVSHRRAMKQAVLRAMQRGALGIKIKVSGRLGGGEMSRKDKEMVGRVPLHTLRADIDYGTAEARTTLGRIGVKVWVYKGDIRFESEERERPAEEEEESPTPGPASSPEPTAAPTE
jgi:small subunit ribosomal protein S3